MIYYVATLAQYVLVEAANAAEAEAKAGAPLRELYRERLGRDVPIAIRTVRPATPEEISLEAFNAAMLQAEANHS